MADAPNRKGLIELLVLVISHSAMRHLAGNDALRSVLDVRYRDLVHGRTLSLESLWALLSDQPEFDPAATRAAMAKLKVLERSLDLEVELPSALGSPDPEDLAQWATEVDVPASLLQSAIKGVKAPAQQTAGIPRARKESSGLLQAALDSELADELKNQHHPSGLAQRFRGWEIPLAIVAVLGLSVAGYSLYGYACNTSHFQAINADFGEIPVKGIQRLGDQVGAILTDPSWLSLPQETREQQLGDALRGLEGDGVTVVYLMSDARQTYASAKLNPASGGVSFRFTE